MNFNRVSANKCPESIEQILSPTSSDQKPFDCTFKSFCELTKENELKPYIYESKNGKIPNTQLYETISSLKTCTENVKEKFDAKQEEKLSKKEIGELSGSFQQQQAKKKHY